METSQPPQDVVDIETLLLGSLVFLGVVFFLGIIVNFPAAVIYLRSRQIRGFTDKFILFVLIVDLLSLLTFIPLSFVFVFEYSVSISAGVTDKADHEDRPIFLDENTIIKKDGNVPDEHGGYPNQCVQQWIVIIHKFIFIMAANLSVLGALKIAIERYLAVVAPLHYHKILKSSVIFFVSLASFILSVVFAVITVADPAEFTGKYLGNQCASDFFGQPWSAVRSEKKQVQPLAMRFDSDDSGLLDESSAKYPYESLHSKPVGVWWPVLKLVHAAVFFILPVTIMIFMYLRIWTEARKQNNRMACHNKSPFILPTDAKKSTGFNIDGLHQLISKFKLVQRIKRKSKMDRAAKVAVLTISLSIFCFGPLFYVQILSAVTSLTKSHMTWGTERLHQGTFAKFTNLMPTLLACLHPLLSPIVYVYRYKKVREELKVLLHKMISSCNCCCDNAETSTDCQNVVQQFNHLTQKLPPYPVSGEVYQQVLESQTVSEGDSDATISINKQCRYETKRNVTELGSADSSDPYCEVHPYSKDRCDDDLGKQEYAEFSDIEGQEYRNEQGISVKPNNGFLQVINGWMSSYSRRWNQHRESVTSTASFITLLSNRSRSIPSEDNLDIN